MDELMNREKIKSLIAEIDSLKKAEANISDLRRVAEINLIEAMEVEQKEGTDSFSIDDYEVKITQKVTKTIDAELLRDVAIEFEITDSLSTLFRWKPSIIAKEWKVADEDVKAKLASAITEKFAKPLVTITTKDGE